MKWWRDWNVWRDEGLCKKKKKKRKKEEEEEAEEEVKRSKELNKCTLSEEGKKESNRSRSRSEITSWHSKKELWLLNFDYLS